ncbi:MAG: hypothetical protein IKZ82_00515 [Clostridia bacterium]|nr:hypothetical protein [Clostridia bacterium]
MRKIQLTATLQQTVDVNIRDAFHGIKRALGFVRPDGFICVRNGELQYGEDISYHGSPLYEYKTISNNPKWIKLYNSIECLEDYLCHADEPQWERKLSEDMDEDESGPVIGM